MTTMKPDDILEKLKQRKANLPAAKGDVVNEPRDARAPQPQAEEAPTQERDVERHRAPEREVAAFRRIPPSDVTEIYYSPFKLISLSALGMVMTGLSALAAAQDNLFLESVGCFGSLFFGMAAGVGIWRLLTAREPVVAITPEGIRDTRIAEEFIPWRSVQAVESVEMERQKFTVLKVEPAVAAKLSLTGIARWSLGSNRLLGVDGLVINPAGLKISHDSLFMMIQKILGIGAIATASVCDAGNSGSPQVRMDVLLKCFRKASPQTEAITPPC